MRGALSSSGRPVLAVGRRTAAAARAAGFSDVTLAGGTAAELGAQLTKRFMSSGPLLYLAGEDRSHDLTAELAPHGVAVCTVVAYRAVKPAAFPAAIVDDHAAEPSTARATPRGALAAGLSGLRARRRPARAGAAPFALLHVSRSRRR